jgi:hypothetical protein
VIRSLIFGITVLFTLMTVTPALASTTPAPAGEFSVSGHHLLRGGKNFTPYGFTLTMFGEGKEIYNPHARAVLDAQINAIAGAWHGNTVRFQVEQDEFLNPHPHVGYSSSYYRNAVFAAISYAERAGLAVVINDTTEGTYGIYTRNELDPTNATVAFWKLFTRYKNDADVILDPFNEPRCLAGSPAHYWNIWHNGNSSYIGANRLVREICGLGFTNQLWMETPGNDALEMLVEHPSVYKLVGRDIVYEYHHTSVDGQPHTPAVWAAQFGNLITRDNLPVVDGEWTNWTLTRGYVYPNGDSGQCWGNAPESVPVYLRYLTKLGIGMTVWTLGPVPGYDAFDYINANGDHTTFTTTDNYDGWRHGCIQRAGAVHKGAGRLIMNWFAQEAKANEKDWNV